MFQYLIVIQPLGVMYGSAGAFLSPENLVGRSGSKFPPEAATLAGLFFSTNYNNPHPKQDFKNNLFVAGPFWAESRDPQKIYVPIPWTKVIAKEDWDEWETEQHNGQYQWTRQKKDVEPDYHWLPISDWSKSAQILQKNQAAKKSPWEFTPILHPKMERRDRVTVSQDGLFLENAVQMREGTCLVYLSTHKLEDGWYKFGGENHMVEITSKPIDQNYHLYKRLQEPIQESFALITPAVWGSNRFSYRYPQPCQNSDSNTTPFPEVVQMLTDKPIPYRFSAGGRLGRGRYAVPAGSVYVLAEPLNKTWWEWKEEWFPEEGYSLKRIGCGLCLPL